MSIKAIAYGAALALTVSAPGAALADDHDGIMAKSPEIVQRGPDGRAQVVMVEGKRYQVCVGERQDSCINPRAAGLKWGDRPLRYWPGESTSES